ncbi:MAG: hypothetical protein ACREPD_05595 [Stenotrophomonas sp.]|uniref:hypothetical protein n=1 Tax=Stenotrophomonas sp. TaxID=69392 RepID=UPI003D6D716B
MSNLTKIVTVVLATIQRSSEVTISDTFFEHEIPILELIHGEDNVNVVNADYHAIELPNNATQEYQRLLTKYGEKYRSVIDQVFRAGPRDVAKELDMDIGKDSFKRQSEAVVESRLPPRPGQKDYETPASTAASLVGGTVTADTDAEEEELEELTHSELRAELTRLGIEHKGNASKADLQALYDAAQAGAADDTLGG